MDMDLRRMGTDYDELHRWPTLHDILFGSGSGESRCI
jgi:hypothetical protein